MKTLDVQPPVLFEVEDFAVFLVDFSVAMRPYTGLFEPEQRMHAGPEKVSMMFFPQVIQKSCHGILHCFFEEFRRSERRVSLYFHNVQLKFFSKSELRQLNEVNDFSAEISYDLIHNR